LTEKIPTKENINNEIRVKSRGLCEITFE
jgi:hypothetical protein